jgi:hypothetical protein
MADNLTDAAENLALNFLFNNQTATRPTLPLKLKLMTANGSDSSAGTELGTSGGYTAGGSTVVFAAAASGAVATNADVSWTNMPAATIVGVEIWDTAGSPVRLAYGALSASKTTNSGDTFTITSGQLTMTLA